MPRSVQVPTLDLTTAGLLDEEAQRVARVDEVKRERNRAMMFVATYASDVEDCRMLLDMLGLLTEPEEYLVDPVPHDCSPRKGVSRR